MCSYQVLIMKFVRFLLAIVLTNLSADQSLSPREAYKYVNQLVELHVDYNSISDELISRTPITYIDDFDTGKCYFTTDELSSIATLSSKQSNDILRDMKAGSLTYYEVLNTAVEVAIERARQYRAEVYALINAENYDAVQPQTFHAHAAYPTGTDSLKNRIKNNIYLWVEKERNVSHAHNFTDNDVVMSLSVYESKVREKEDKYLHNSKSIPARVVKAYAHALDSHTDFFSPAEAKAMRSSLQKQVKGVGVMLSESGRGVYIAGLVPGSPAHKHPAVRKGDFIREINSKPLCNVTFSSVLNLMSEHPECVKLSLVSPSENDVVKEVSLKKEKITLDQERVQVSTVPCSGGVIAQLEFSSFYDNGGSITAEKDIRNALKEVEKEHPVKGVVIDLRKNPGGFLSQAVKICGLFVPKGIIAVAQYKNNEIQYNRDFNGRRVFNGPVVVLISKGSASASEVVAQSLQDYGAAIIVGDETSYGKGTMQVQNVMNSNANAFYKVTVGRYFTVSGASPQLRGVTADIVAPTRYEPYRLGEKYLRYSIPRKPLGFSLLDEENPLTKADQHTKALFNYYFPKRESRWVVQLPILKARSARRVNAPKYRAFIEQSKLLHDGDSRAKEVLNQCGDMPLLEATQVVFDMMELDQKRQLSAA